MRDDAVCAAEAAAWLAKARQDRDRVARCLGAEPPDIEDALFHCQQAAEKAVKALLAWHDEPFRKTHDLAQLGMQCAVHEPALRDLLNRLDDLTEYAWGYRYPGDFVSSRKLEIGDASVMTDEIVEAASRRIDPQG